MNIRDVQYILAVADARHFGRAAERWFVSQPTLSGQVMEVCHLAERPQKGAMADLRAASLETLLHLVGAGFGCTLVPALAIRGGWMTDSGIIARPIELPDAHRLISLVFRRTFPRRAALESFAGVVKEQLPNTVTRSS